VISENIRNPMIYMDKAISLTRYLAQIDIIRMSGWQYNRARGSAKKPDTEYGNRHNLTAPNSALRNY